MWQYVPFGWTHSELKLEKKTGSASHQCQKYHIIFYKSVFSSITDPGSPFFSIPWVPTFWKWFKMMMYIIYLELCITTPTPPPPIISSLSGGHYHLFSLEEKTYLPFHNCVFECVLGMGRAGQNFSFQSINLFLPGVDFAPIYPGDIWSCLEVFFGCYNWGRSC